MTETLRLRADHPADVHRAAQILRHGGLVAFPTETVYGLGANAFSAVAIRRIFEAKQRPSWDPLIVHLPHLDAVDRIATLDGELEGRGRRLASACWPRPLTLLLPKVTAIPDEVTAGRTTVGVRVPSHPVAEALLKAVGLPIAAPSANRFGHISPTTAEHVLDDLDGRIEAVLDGGPTAVGVESTVLDPSETPMRLYRAGAFSAETLEQVAGVPVEVLTGEPEDANSASPDSLASPGLGIRHYAPEVPLQLSGPNAAALAEEVEAALRATTGRVGVLLPTGWQVVETSRVTTQAWAIWEDERALAATLFAGLRALEKGRVEKIICPLPPSGGLRDALRDRLLKAARSR